MYLFPAAATAKSCVQELDAVLISECRPLNNTARDPHCGLGPWLLAECPSQFYLLSIHLPSSTALWDIEEHMGRLTGKRAVVTGGSNGIGRAIVQAFAHEGAAVFFTHRTDRAAAEEVALHVTSLGVRSGHMQLDAREQSAPQRLLEDSVAFHGSVDIVVNNAGTYARTPFLDITPDEYETVLDVNLRFPFFTTQLFARHMQERNIKGTIINVSSLSATRAVSRMAHYQCSKAALHMLTRSAAFELAPSGIRVNTISPGLTATKANRDQWHDNPAVWQRRGKMIPMGRTGLPSDHAGAAVFLASDEASWMTGANLPNDRGQEVV